MNWQSLLKTFVFNEFENTSVQLVKEWEESLLEVIQEAIDDAVEINKKMQ